MSSEFVMGAKLVLTDAFSGTIKAAAKATGFFSSNISKADNAVNEFRSQTKIMTGANTRFVSTGQAAAAAVTGIGAAANKAAADFRETARASAEMSDQLKKSAVTDNFTNPVKSASKATGAFGKSVAQANAATGVFLDQSGRMRNVNGQFMSSERQAAAAMTDFGKQSRRSSVSFRDSMKESIRSATELRGSIFGVKEAVVALAAGVAVKRGFSWLVGANADMEQFENTLTVVLNRNRDAAKDMLGWANKFAATTPFEIPQVVEATVRLQSYGIQAKKTLGIVGDMASVMGKDLMQAVEAVADAQTGELERMKEFGITKQMIQDQAKLFGSNPINNQGSITDIKAFNAALFSLMEKRFQGGMEMQSQSFKGMLSNASDFMGNMGRQLGQPLFDKTKKQFQGFLATLNQLQENGKIDAWVKKAQQAGSTVGRVFQGAYRVTVAAFRGIGAVVRPIIDGIRKHWETWGPIIQTLGYSFAFFVTALGAVKMALTAASLAMQLLNAAMLTNPVGWIILGIGLLIGLFVKLNGGIEGTKKVLAGWFNQAKAYWQSDQVQGWASKAIAAFQQLAAWAVQAFSWIHKQAVHYLPAIQATVNQAFGYFQTNVLPILKQLLDVAVQTFTRIWAVAKPLGVAIFSFFQAIAPSVLGLVKGIAWVVKNVLWPVFTEVWKVIVGIASAVIPVVGAIVGGIVKGFTAVLNWASVIWPAVSKIVGFEFKYLQFLWAAFGPFVMAALQVVGAIIVGGFKVIMAVVKFVWTTISSIIQIAWAVISGIIQTALGILTGDWKMAWEGFKSIFTGVWDGITKFMGGVGSLFYDSGKAIIETLVSGIKSVAEAPAKAIKNVLEKVRQYLPFSDAKRGPLSALTYSGGAIMTTLSTGVHRKAADLRNAVTRAFSNAAPNKEFTATANTAVQRSAAQMAPVASLSDAGANISPSQVNAAAAPAAQRSGPQITVGNLVGKIELHAAEGQDADDLVDQFIDRQYEKAKDIADIFTPTDKEVLV